MHEKQEWDSVVRASIAVVGILAVLLWGVLSSSPAAQLIREGAKAAFDDDFSIKESIGKVFMIESSEQNSTAVNADAEVVSLAPPADGIMQKSGDGIKIDCEIIAGVYAVCNGKIEECGEHSITILHDNGWVSEYVNCEPFIKTGARVQKGQLIACAEKSLIYKLCIGGVPVDPLAFFEYV